jgi:hypothetical protein
VLTRLWFSLSIGEKRQDLGSWKVVEVQELTKGEIWSVTCSSSSSSTETFYILESTCEVIGHPPIPSCGVHMHNDYPSLPVRADWAEYISFRLLPPSSHDLPPPLLWEYVKWTNHEEYDRGISRHWLRRTIIEGEVGLAKKTVAERYILACVVGNRFVAQHSFTTK